MKATDNELEHIQDDDLLPGDILIFKLPSFNPSRMERFIKFIQLVRNDSRQDANSIHAAVVTENGNIVHFIEGGHKKIKLDHSYYRSFAYDRFRAKDDENQQAIFLEATKPQQMKTHYSCSKMLVAFIRHENIPIPNKVKAATMFHDLNNKANTEEICSSFVWRCIKNAAAVVGNNTKYKETTSFILPGTLARRLRHDDNFELRSNLKDEKMILSAMQEIRNQWEKDCRNKENKKPSFWRRGKHNLANLQARYSKLQDFVYKHMHSTDAQKILEEGLILISANADINTRNSRAYHFLQKMAERRGITANMLSNDQVR